MKNLEAEFIISAVDSKHFPVTELPEVAFSGRSNVGKSSLLNSIVKRKNLAHISSTPGKTRQINFYLVENKKYFSDLPGFGYASVSKTEREKWMELNLEYLKSRENLRLVCCLVDSRHDPMEHDLALIEFLENNDKKFIIILTKCDKISKKAVIERKEQYEQLTKFCRNCLEVLPYSVKEETGNSELTAIIRRESDK
jgi:GTP-binding protein